MNVYYTPKVYIKTLFLFVVLFSESSARSDTDSSDSDQSVKRPPKKCDDKSNVKSKF